MTVRQLKLHNRCNAQILLAFCMNHDSESNPIFCVLQSNKNADSEEGLERQKIILTKNNSFKMSLVNQKHTKYGKRGNINMTIITSQIVIL